MKADVYYDDLGKDMRVEEIPEDMRAEAEEYRTQLLEAVADFDDEIMEMYLEGEEIPTEMIKAAIRKARRRSSSSRSCAARPIRTRRAEAAGRHRRLYAVPAGHPADHRHGAQDG